MTASPTVSAMNFSVPMGASDATMAADMMAMAEVGPTMAWREVPNRA